MEFGSVTLKRIGFFVFQFNTQHSGQDRNHDPSQQLEQGGGGKYFECFPKHTLLMEIVLIVYFQGHRAKCVCVFIVVTL